MFSFHVFSFNGAGIERVPLYEVVSPFHGIRNRGVPLYTKVYSFHVFKIGGILSFEGVGIHLYNNSNWQWCNLYSYIWTNSPRSRT